MVCVDPILRCCCEYGEMNRYSESQPVVACARCHLPLHREHADPYVFCNRHAGVAQLRSASDF